MTDDLFGDNKSSHPPHTRARTEDPWTSHAAALRIQHGLTEKQARVLAIHRAHKMGLTNWELEVLAGSHNSTWRTRVSELVDLGYLVNSGHVKRIAASDDPRAHRIIWVCREHAMDLFMEGIRNP